MRSVRFVDSRKQQRRFGPLSLEFRRRPLLFRCRANPSQTVPRTKKFAASRRSFLLFGLRHSPNHNRVTPVLFAGLLTQKKRLFRRNRQSEACVNMTIFKIKYCSVTNSIDALGRFRIIISNRSCQGSRRRGQMNRECKNQSREWGMWRAVRAASVGGQPALAWFGMRAARARSAVWREGAAQLAWAVGVCHVGLPRQRRQQGLVGPPFFLIAFCGVLLSRLRGLGLFLQGRSQIVGNAPAEISSGNRITNVSWGWSGASVAARSGSSLRWEKSRVGGSTRGQMHRNRDVGQLGQTQISLKRYKIGMFANLAMLANDFVPISFGSGSIPRSALPRIPADLDIPQVLYFNG